MKKAILEQVHPLNNESFIVRHFPNEEIDKPRYPWHYHEEIELLYVKGGQGERFIGNHLSSFSDGDLAIIGSNVPHAGFTNEDTKEVSQTIVHLRKAFFDNALLSLPELWGVKALFNKSLYGISFGGEDKDRIGQKMEQLLHKTGLEQLILLLSILDDMVKSKHRSILNTSINPQKINDFDKNRIQIVYNYIEQHFRDEVKVKDVADQLSLSESGFCRYFKKTTGNTFSSFLNQYRIIYACRLIKQSNESFRDIAFKSGFNNFSYFFRVFKKNMGSSPSQYKKNIEHIWEKSPLID